LFKSADEVRARTGPTTRNYFMAHHVKMQVDRAEKMDWPKDKKKDKKKDEKKDE